MNASAYEQTMLYAAPSRCSICGKPLQITRLTCPNCASEINGNFTPCKYCGLNDRQKLFLDTFLKARGNIKEVERILSISYPTVKSLLEDLLRTLFPEERLKDDPGMNSSQILDKLSKNEITTDEAIRLLNLLSSGKNGQ